ncbi:MAG: DUF938 domain-containing protein [Spirulinaceae cyanobacterium]
MNQNQDSKSYAPATQRNREPILAVLSRVLPPQGTVLEISSGTGEHAVFFAPSLYPRHWLPSDPNPLARASIQAWCEDSPADNLHSPVDIDVQESLWSIEKQPLPTLQNNPITAIVNINMIHIAPWAACLGLMAGAKRILSKGGILYLYGPFKQDGQHTAPSNQDFDLSLRQRNPEWGIRDLDEVIEVAKKCDFALQEVVSMPANNLSVIFNNG